MSYRKRYLAVKVGLVRVCIWCALAVLTACGGGGHDNDGSPPPASVTAPMITQQPAPVTVTEGSSATFAVAASGTAPLAVQWMRDGADIVGATELTIVTPTLSLGDSGAKFSARVTNAAGNVTSGEAVLTVTPMPTTSTAKGTLAPNVRVLSDAEAATITRRTTAEVVFSVPIVLLPGTVVMGTSDVFKVVSSSVVGSETTVATVDPELGEIFTSLRLQGSFNATPEMATPASSSGAHRTLGTKRAADVIGATETFSSPISLTDGGLTLTSTFASTLTATVDYDFDSTTGLKKSSLEVKATDSLTIQADYLQTAMVDRKIQLKLVTIPIPVSIYDSALRAIGVRLVDISIPIYAGARARSSFQFSIQDTLTADGKVRIDYDPASGATATATFAGTETVGTLKPTTPAGTPTFATASLSAGIYVGMSPALSFLNRLALLGVDTTLSVDSSDLLQAIPAQPPYCLTLDTSLNVSVQGFFQLTGLARAETNPFTVRALQTPLTYVGNCLAPVLVTRTADQTAPAEYGSPITISVNVALDSSKANGSPSAAPSGQVTLTVQGDSCVATLVAQSDKTAAASCALTPLASGVDVPVQITYPGDTHYAPGSLTTSVSINAPVAIKIQSATCTSTSASTADLVVTGTVAGGVGTYFDVNPNSTGFSRVPVRACSWTGRYTPPGGNSLCVRAATDSTTGTWTMTWSTNIPVNRIDAIAIFPARVVQSATDLQTSILCPGTVAYP